MSDIVCITNRRLCTEDLIYRIERLASCHPAAIILREKDLSEDDYKYLAKQAIMICDRYCVPCVLHKFADVAASLNTASIHLSLNDFMILSPELKKHFSTIGVSCHSVQDVLNAEHLGCTYVTAGHVFDTDCKKGLAGRGLDFLRSVCSSASVPVLAIGGINAEHAMEVRRSGASGICVMSGAMSCDNPEAYLASFQ